MFIQTEATPNPATLKFLPGRVVMTEGTFEARSPESAEASPLAQRLFGVPGVTGVFYGYDFITVTKADGEWQHLKPAILGGIMEHFMTGLPLFANEGGPEETDSGEEFFDEEDFFFDEEAAPSDTAFPTQLQEMAAAPKNDEVVASLQFRAPCAAGRERIVEADADRVVGGIRSFRVRATR